ncbi:MAG: hypothetical protein MJ194_05290 [Clostridia bacterium]|nr:hypothetical protein [Clostridia bacterium]
MTLNITAGEELNKILSQNCGVYVPFNEAMIRGRFSAPLFSEEFIEERCSVHGVSREEYLANMAPFLKAMDHLKDYDSVVLWFGDEDFCRANRSAVILYLGLRGCKVPVTLNIVDEYSGQVLRSEKVEISNICGTC